ncbi:hypothetical protein EHS25_008347 [Saitozyma podzolica]|uniref:Glycoside hydrolase family 2 protein n=1 Tax=Saitozyma podzolica TaxID=1890683 RepID=A0A427YP98_9TREE|nr:hypothetical protein EHS25_008347 [Saitozyma podzolica]
MHLPTSPTFLSLSILPLISLSLFPVSLAATKDYQVQTPPLTTNWTYTAGTDPWTEYPRPQLVRPAWQSLNGVWAWRNATGGLDELGDPPTGQTFDDPVLVPSCLESGLSGVQAPLAPNGTVLTTWWQTTFTVPSDWNGDNVIINFGAVDYESTVFINGHNATFHRGGYTRFYADITPYLNANGTNELLVFVHDPTDNGEYVIPIGKQTLRPSHIFYTPCTGIWQSVFIEPVPASHIAAVDISADMDGLVNITVHSSDGSAQSVNAYVHTNSSTHSMGGSNGTSNSAFTFTVPNPSLWSPDSPALYNVTITMGSDVVEVYTGFRTVSRGTVGNVTRPLLNGKFVFAFGPLDQGFWPDGLYVPPTHDAMVYDLQVLKSLGFNMVRKHIKVETDL